MSGSLRIHSCAAFLVLFTTVFRKTAEKMCLSFRLTCGNLWNTVILLRPNRLPANCTYEIYCTHRHHQSLLPPGNWEFQTITVKKETKVVVKTEQETAQYILIKYLDASFSNNRLVRVITSLTQINSAFCSKSRCFFVLFQPSIEN